MAASPFALAKLWDSLGPLRQSDYVKQFFLDVYQAAGRSISAISINRPHISPVLISSHVILRFFRSNVTFYGNRSISTKLPSFL